LRFYKNTKNDPIRPKFFQNEIKKFALLRKFLNSRNIFLWKIGKSILEGGVVAENFVKNNLAQTHSCVRSPANCDGGDHQVEHKTLRYVYKK